MQSFEKAVAELDLDLPENALRLLRKRIGRGEAPPDASDIETKVKDVLIVLETALKDVAALDWPDSGAALFEGLRRGQKRLRKSWSKAKKHPSPESMHEWRKRVKDQSAQLRLFRSVAPRPLENLRAEAKETAEHLGEEHDLWLLSERLAAEPVPKRIEKARAQLLAAIEKRRALLRRLAFERGKRFSSRNAKTFAGALVDAWKAAATPTRNARRKKPRAASASDAPTSQVTVKTPSQLLGGVIASVSARMK